MTNNTCDSFCNKLVKFIRGKDFGDRSLAAQEKFAETGLQLSDKLFLGALIWFTLPFAFTVNELLKDPKFDKLPFTDLVLVVLKPFGSTSFLFFIFLTTVFLFVTAAYVRRRALDDYDKYELNKNRIEK